MNIIGPDALAFGVDDVGACRDYLTTFGLKPIDVDDTGGFFEALDGTGVFVRRRDDPRLPAPMETASMLRQTIYGVADQATVNAIGDELQGTGRWSGATTAPSRRRTTTASRSSFR